MLIQSTVITSTSTSFIPSCCITTPLVSKPVTGFKQGCVIHDLQSKDVLSAGYALYTIQVSGTEIIYVINDD